MNGTLAVRATRYPAGFSGGKRSRTRGGFSSDEVDMAWARSKLLWAVSKIILSERKQAEREDLVNTRKDKSHA
jgi:hypothetical protein